MTSALSRLAAASKLMRVRVESSKNRLTTVLPRSVGSLRISRSWVAAIWAAVSRMRIASSRLRSWVPSRCFTRSPPVRITASSPSISTRCTSTRSDARGGDVLAHEVGPDGQLAVPPVHQHRQLDATAACPRSLTASSAARIVRPVWKTSSTRTTTASSMPCGGSVVGPMVRVGWRCRSSRYIVMSSAPHARRGIEARLDRRRSWPRAVRREGGPASEFPGGRCLRLRHCVRGSREQCGSPPGQYRARQEWCQSLATSFSASRDGS